MHLETLDSFRATQRRPKLERRIFWWVVLSRLGPCNDDVLDLESCEPERFRYKLYVPDS